ncbi:uncharacterized protein BX664DRAFT_388941 [Halteromyces radiatus]|uniref:uncharacterized protein n=1 Tax=Halteromyces radiatus TaxID=101107 RepID=UPI00221EC029|nr:uncharacterized protein BX664DRAFT_388941 [Halteromyces radiatus]KAI8079994.1 hypothetical protein BX664DRAFT_388941 [Halteromyces radiatus]
MDLILLFTFSLPLFPAHEAGTNATLTNGILKIKKGFKSWEHEFFKNHQRKLIMKVIQKEEKRSLGRRHSQTLDMEAKRPTLHMCLRYAKQIESCLQDHRCAAYIQEQRERELHKGKMRAIKLQNEKISKEVKSLKDKTDYIYKTFFVY